MSSNQDSCFAIMPFKGEFNQYYIEIIKPTVESMNFQCIRADEIYNPNVVMKDVFEKIEKSKFLIADVTGKNPNVNYELGIAHALNKPVIIISQSIEDVPFDYKHLRICLYRTDKVNWVRDLELELKKFISSIILNPQESIIHTFKSDLVKEHLATTYFLHETYLGFDYIMTQENVYEVLNDKTTILNRKYTILPSSNMSHLLQAFRVDKDGNFKITELKDPTTHRSLNHIIHTQNEKELVFFILRESLEPPGKHFMIEMTLEIDNYFCNIFDKGKDFIGGMPIGRSKGKYISITETINLPNTNQFKNAHIKIKNHPNFKFLEQVINNTPQNNKLTISHQFVEGNGIPFTSSIGYDIYI